jgi:hypothetical protein
MMQDPDFRPIGPRERCIIGKLLAADFPGRADIVAQCADALVKVVDKEGSFAIRPASGAPLAKVRQRVASEAFYPDREGVEDLALDEAAFAVPCVHVLLHVRDGHAHEIEIYKDDGTVIAIEPERATFRFYPDFPLGWVEGPQSGPPFHHPLLRMYTVIFEKNGEQYSTYTLHAANERAARDEVLARFRDHPEWDPRAKNGVS